MPKFDANLTMLFGEVDFLDRFEAAAKAGFTAVEYLFPYAYPKELLVEKLRQNGLVQVLLNLPAGNWEKGERGIGCLPDRVNEFREGVGKAIEYATALGCKQVNCLMGYAPENVSRLQVHYTVVSNVRFAAVELKKAGIRLLIEPCNTRDMPGFYLNHTAQALEIIKAANSDNVFIQYDIYHAQVMEGDLCNTIEKNLAHIGHIQIADNPGRHEPGTGEINYPYLFTHLDRMGYSGWVGCEYKPAARTEEGLRWRTELVSGS
ncbi:MAG: hydroxypyruvate isomerase [Desulfobaccales bacterium]